MKKIRLPRKAKKEQKKDVVWFLCGKLEYRCHCDKWGYVMRCKQDIINNPSIYKI